MIFGRSSFIKKSTFFIKYYKNNFVKKVCSFHKQLILLMNLTPRTKTVKYH